MTFDRFLLAALMSFAPITAQACDTALILTIDVSNSVDTVEYRLQTDGLADALQDPAIVDTIVAGGTTIAVVQWSGVDKQTVSIPWMQVRSALDVQSLSQKARLLERAFVLSDTAPAEAVLFSLKLFDQVPNCTRRVIDISGDGTPNSGSDVRAARNLAERQGVTINAIAIESMGLAITNFFRSTVITRNGFVMTARTHREYPATLRAKILREISRVFG
ncbi:MAG: Ca-activated chloride channel family protein [Yoonia sp.]|jgi:Ca-activated chloride channel family protein